MSDVCLNVSISADSDCINKQYCRTERYHILNMAVFPWGQRATSPRFTRRRGLGIVRLIVEGTRGKGQGGK